jgi:putative DNA primase/helicase
MSASVSTLADFGIHLRHPNRPGQQRAPCPECDRGKKDDALAVKLERDGSATWLCHRCGWKGGTGNGGDRPWSPPAPAVKRQREPEPERYDRLAPWAERIWSQRRPITPSSPAGRYLEGRGCALPPWPEESDLRWHSEMRHPSGYVGPALVALVTNIADGEPISLHRTWLARDGSRKAGPEELGEGGKPRLLLARHRGDGVVRLWPDAEVSYGLVLGEGIETCLAAARAGLQPVWAALSAGNLAAFPVLPGIGSLTVLVDNDDSGAGQDAALELIERYEEAGFDPESDLRVVMSPEPGEDANDLVRRMLGS